MVCSAGQRTGDEVEILMTEGECERSWQSSRALPAVYTPDEEVVKAFVGLDA